MARSILMLSMYGEAALVQQALGACARGYILKDARDVDLPTAVKQATSGALVLDPVASVAADRARMCGLSARQLKVLQLLCEGLTNQAIAERLAISANTVAVHRARIMTRLGTHSAGALVAYAIRHGLVHAR